MASIEMKLKPFSVPNFVIVEEPPRLRQEGFKQPRSIPLSEVPVATLEAMCAEFRAAVLAKSGNEAQLWR